MKGMARRSIRGVRQGREEAGMKAHGSLWVCSCISSGGEEWESAVSANHSGKGVVERLCVITMHHSSH